MRSKKLMHVLCTGKGNVSEITLRTFRLSLFAHWNKRTNPIMVQWLNICWKLLMSTYGGAGIIKTILLAKRDFVPSRYQLSFFLDLFLFLTQKLLSTCLADIISVQKAWICTLHQAAKIHRAQVEEQSSPAPSLQEPSDYFLGRK